MEQEATQLLADLRVALEKGGQFILEQAPPLAKEIIAYGRAVSIVETVLALALVLWCVRFWFKLAPKFVEFIQITSRANYDIVPRGGAWRVVALIAHMPLAGGSTIWFLCSLDNLVMAWTSPRYWLLKQILGMLHGGSCR